MEKQRKHTFASRATGIDAEFRGTSVSDRSPTISGPDLNWQAMEVVESEQPLLVTAIPSSNPHQMHIVSKRQTDCLKQYGSDDVNAGHIQRLHGLYRTIVALLEQEKYYRNPNLSLRMLADRLNTNTKYVSEAVNGFAGCNFMTFVNSYRVNEVCEALRRENAPDHMLEISIKSGFSSVATFYRVFKKFRGVTPGRYHTWACSQGN